MGSRYDRKLKIVTIGGGHGQSVALKAVLPFSRTLTAVVSTADDGGCSGILRGSGMPPPGDLRRCLTSMATHSRRARSLELRTNKGRSYGNLILADIWKKTLNLQEASDQVGSWLGASGRVCPILNEAATLVATTRDGDLIVGETAVDAHQDRILELRVRHEGRLNPAVRSAIQRAEVILIGPGSFFTSILACLLVDDLRNELRACSALKIFVTNLALSAAEQDRFTDGVGAVRWLQQMMEVDRTDPDWLILTHGPENMYSASERMAVSPMQGAGDRHSEHRLYEGIQWAIRSTGLGGIVVDHTDEQRLSPVRVSQRLVG
ncbi:MAG: 2-phospho-L-lactate transferase CofD family protein [Myxococcota bacterium]